MADRNLDHRRANFKGKTQFSATEVCPILVHTYNDHAMSPKS